MSNFLFEICKYLSYSALMCLTKKQIVIGLLTDESGHAVSINTYKGNTNDVSTFIEQLDIAKIFP
jgi:hypothetical protein